ncbi:hypothetical protein BHE74_00054170 [Ensete ventricosum]|nr:hypothetical protein GW17_00044952 [Ensete ventricosum]RWW40419.1 hypothetical protein BHE74_00054170 [Ensete ventricosum]
MRLPCDRSTSTVGFRVVSNPTVASIGRGHRGGAPERLKNDRRGTADRGGPRQRRPQTRSLLEACGAHGWPPPRLHASYEASYARVGIGRGSAMGRGGWGALAGTSERERER